jgi:hypothetical protein
MISEQNDNYTLLKDEHDDIEGFASFLERIYDQFKEKNLIIDLLKYEDATLKNLLCYLNLSNKHRASKQSFVIVNIALPIEEIPDELLVVPTITEAVDVINLEDMERDLGF